MASPFDSWLVLRGLRTLAVRMDRHSDNAEQVAAFLVDHPRVTEVFFPGLPNHPGHDLAKRQMRRFGGMVSFRVAGGEQAALDVCARTKVIILGESLGGVESLIEHPGKMTHASVAGTRSEVPGDLVRLSVGIEDVDDLIADLDQALALTLDARHCRIRRAELRCSEPSARLQRAGPMPTAAQSGAIDGGAARAGRAGVGPAERAGSRRTRDRADNGEGCALAR